MLHSVCTCALNPLSQTAQASVHNQTCQPVRLPAGGSALSEPLRELFVGGERDVAWSS